jgi:hypothetical protein
MQNADMHARHKAKPIPLDQFLVISVSHVGVTTFWLPKPSLV